MSRHFKEARQMNQMTLSEAAEKLGVSVSALSSWEASRTAPSLESFENMANLYDVTTDYLLGRGLEESDPPTEQIHPKALPAYDGKPIWSPQYGWLLVHAAEKMLICSDGRSLSFMDCRQLYIAPPLFAEPSLPSGLPLSLSEIRHWQQVWVEPVSPDSDLRRELRGWYRVDDRFVENEYGTRFYMDTYRAKWLAFELGS